MLPGKVWSVSQLVAHLKRLVDEDPALQKLWVVGELANVRRHSSGHWYFTLKDAASIRCVMFRSDAQSLRFHPEDGQAVVVAGRLSVYERDGQCQVYVRYMEPVGMGERYLALEALKRRLAEEGLFSRPKRRLPDLPRAVGVVTSPVGAALQDVRTVTFRRFPGLRLVVAPVLVQGERAPESIVAGLARVAAHPLVDVIIVARGGGSKEDLGAFNDERVVRAVAACPKPVVSAVGHEIDVTLTDLAADVRAPTPSAAAEMTVPERAVLLDRVAAFRRRLVQHVRWRVAQERRRLDGWSTHGVLASPTMLLTGRRMAVARLAEAMEAAYRHDLAGRRARLSRLAGRLEALDPLAVLERGYSLVTDAAGHHVRARDVRVGQTLVVTWADGRWDVASVRAHEAEEGAERDGGGGRRTVRAGHGPA
ncbi:MAG: exodeoxyribonuclease VII large subunit [Actinomycetia bacterium]|nr:exodeoxyribonuclease VII large subunit [Actinomycetes bacterium]